MNGSLTPLDLEAIARESRNCFLSEEAPDYLVILEQGIGQLGDRRGKIDNLEEQYQKLIRAAHSLKGGAGLAEMPALSQLSHKLEDLLIAIQEHRVSLHEEGSNPGKNLPGVQIGSTSAYQLLLLSLDRVSTLLMKAFNEPELPRETTTEIADPVCDAIDAFLHDRGGDDAQILDDPAQLGSSTQVSGFVKTALEVDLEECLQRVESIGQQDRDNHFSMSEAIANFADECTLLGEALDLVWLSEIGAELEQWSQQSEIPFDRVERAIEQIRISRDRTLNGSSATNSATEVSHSPEDSTDPQIESVSSPEISEPFADLDPPEPPKLSANLPQRFLKYLIGRPTDGQSLENINLRVSLSRIDRMTKRVGELLINYERLQQCQQQLESGILNPDFSAYSAPKSLDPNVAQNLRSSMLLKAFSPTNKQIDLHQLDIILGARNLRSTLADMRQSLEQLHADLTQARMVPFQQMTDRFFVLIDDLNQKYQKSVNLVVSGQDVLIDRWILEQLQTPLTHLLRNAFDHGIELPQERSTNGKSDRATINLSASSHGSHVVIKIADDGRGIDPQKVYQKAVAKGLIATNQPAMNDNEIMQFLFTPGFSTAAQVTDISGRGVGLDIVVEQVKNLRGSVELNTALGTGTTFTISIPLTLSLLPLLIVRCQQRTLAMTAAKILEVINLAESDQNTGVVKWQNQSLPIFDLGKLLPYTRRISPPENSATKSDLGLVVNVNDRPVVLAVDSLLGEKRLILKPLDPRVPVPPYVAGCTVLGTGEMIPVLTPEHFDLLVESPAITSPENLDNSPSNNSPESSAVKVKPTQKTIASIEHHHPPRILIVDDSLTVRRSLQQLLSHAGFAIESASDGEEGFTTLARSHGEFDLILSDLEMPNLDGFGLLRKIRQSQWKDVSVAMLTSRSNEEYMKTAQDLGVKAYFTKPFKADELLNSIMQIVGNL